MKTLIHPTAVIHPGAQLDSTVEVGAYAVVGDRVTIGAGTTIGAHAVIEGPTEIGANNRIFPGAAIGLEPQDLKYKGALSLVKIGDGNCFREYVTINRATDVGEVTRVGSHNLLMAYVHVAHNCQIDDLVVIANAVAIAGHVHIESQAVIGGVSGIHQFVHIGRLAMIGGMTKIVRDVPPYMLVEGYPAQVRSLNLVGLKRAGFTSAELAQLKSAFRILYRSQLSLNEAIEKLDSLLETEKLQHLSHFIRLSQQAGRRGLVPGKRMKNAESGE
ncbi:acyl-ACP--UDP-N-acetylglucosamine O-acyltransferase [Merismopedia glauca]|uniref:Acyl-[acyl-carrier-protein]--UDP-N-acetylglucosamine O-acyltransferase n=1 Tax=Merismopedia glauca CCAP 1448/3 TaxID=1296344 RepID=A0A2T1C6G9_9CYAN|nr:acyl-ACP--UDP-N-acetylglucosamine O-acyltransferase [Merismopedia glauca]PSB03737.1 acyl-[acyl-carrier-protein]--UDP-N-acetylglucosamine O-acyltransferase [Merismopedia glauca CCAP 1448/3]